MSKSKILTEWELKTTPRYTRQNMERAMGGRVERGLVELITNSDDSYRNLEDRGKRILGKIIIEIERRKEGSSTLRIRDRAQGMSKREMQDKLGTLGGRTSGFEKGKPRRGLNGRGAKDIAAFGMVHFESIKNEEYSHFEISPSLKCRLLDLPRKVTPEDRQKLRIPRGNGTIVTVEVESHRFQIPRHESLIKDFSRYYSLRDIFSNPNREVMVADLNRDRKARLTYRYPEAEIVFNDWLEVPGYPEAKAHLLIHRHPSPFKQDRLPYREGILVKSAAAIHDCTYFGLEPEPLAWRFTGEIHCEFIDKLVREYDDREEENPDHPNYPPNNPMRLLDPFRDGLICEHPFVKSLYGEGRQIIGRLIEDLKAIETPLRREVSNEDIRERLDKLSKEASKVFVSKLKELEEEIHPTIYEGSIKELPIGLHIIPSHEDYFIPIFVDEPKTFSVVVKSYETLDEALPIEVSSSDARVKIHSSPVYFRKLFEDGKVGRATFACEASTLGAEAYIEVRYDGYDGLVFVAASEPHPPPTPPEVPEGLSFDKPSYHVRLNKEKELILWLKTDIKPKADPLIATLSSNHTEIVIKGGMKCELKADTQGIFKGEFRILGRQLKARGRVTALIEGFNPAQTQAIVEEHEDTGRIFRSPEPTEEDFSPSRYKWKTDQLLEIGAKHPTIRRYLGTPDEGEGYPGINSRDYRLVLAEVVAEALAFKMLQEHFKKMGELNYDDVDLYYHRDFSDFLSVAHRALVELE